MVHEKLFADLVDLYNNNVKLYKEQNTGLIIDKVRPLLIEDVEKIFINVKEIINHDYINQNYRSFTVNPQQK